MKIGLELEGVILKNGNPFRWSEMTELERIKIKTRSGAWLDQQDPVDRYDILAEVRTEPLENPTGHQLAQALLDEVQKTSSAFKSMGYTVSWTEHLIGVELNRAVNNDLAQLPKKDTFCVGEEKTSLFCPKDNDYIFKIPSFRGGGVHINVSPLHWSLTSSFALLMHEHLRQFTPESFSSPYRKNLLFRQKPNRVAEYMSLGLSLDSDLAAASMTCTRWADVVVDVAHAIVNGKTNQRLCYGI